MSGGRVRLSIDGRVATLTFDRPKAHNAMTWAMYDELGAACQRLRADRGVGAVILRGEGGRAFISGTDISQFTEISDGDAGLAYEARIETSIGDIERIPQPTLALVDGWAVGFGLALAAACDFRLATPAARFGAPIARTVGNCLSLANTRRLVAGVGVANAKRILMLGEMIAASDALRCGFVMDVVEPDALEARAAQLVDTLLSNAPLTMRVSKEMIRRIVQDETDGDGADLIAEIYGSEDFKTGVRAFVGKTRPTWRAR
jgi:enoyl-CoA hydratase